MGVQKGKIPSGVWRIADYVAATPFHSSNFSSLGELGAAPFSFNTQKATMASGNSTVGGNAETYTHFSDGSIELQLKHITAQNLALGLNAELVTVAATPITGEAHKAYTGGFVPSENLIDITQPVVLKKGATVIDTDDYTVRVDGIEYAASFTTAGLITADDVTWDYTPIGGYNIEALVNSAPEKRLLYTGHARNLGKYSSAKVWRCKPELVNSLQTVVTNNEYMDITLRFEILEDPTITEPGLSKFQKLEEPNLSA
jgi:hypothetical protein